jgi:hypothetical protein
MRAVELCHALVELLRRAAALGGGELEILSPCDERLPGALQRPARRLLVWGVVATRHRLLWNERIRGFDADSVEPLAAARSPASGGLLVREENDDRVLEARHGPSLSRCALSSH